LIGRAEETEAEVKEALRLSPRDALAYLWCNLVGIAKGLLGEYAQALPWLTRSIEANKFVFGPRFHRAACLALLGRLDEARADVNAGLALEPKFTIGLYSSLMQSDDATYLAQRERLIEGMRKAGVPER